MQPRQTPDPIWIVYDGECPFCSAYVRMVRLREAVGTVALIDARTDHPAVREAKSLGLDLDEGMALKMAGEWLHGDAVMTRLAMLSSRSNTLNRLHAWVFQNPARARLLYPWLRAGRNAVLRLLGRRKITELA
ncbi:DUF393 domain-containing protein [Hankyongella ginsenosidimutans]|uniref:DUF393 domain-containing protein n=1 Tax=Hankyongella ginsenosidimutans TaxID=1763828 RepID=A0A4D7C882_9SPHN|nr:DCC1-like thiol-disulfide oxidoreductase family protein [Hankyongella ginsenosidimutans]QCI80480.1 DUF393 domain-containing protein [Hankyongella ginsenosidimutans]TXG81989.1 MAG: DUF393 domain-containing protein [Sphingomonadales bacterium]